MNDLIQLKGTLKDRGNPSSGGGVSLSSNQNVSTKQLEKLYNDLVDVKKEWENKKILNGVLISAYYTRIVPKSKRISKLFSGGSEHSNDYIVGIKFFDSNPKKHIITYYITKEQLDRSINKVYYCKKILDEKFNGIIDDKIINVPKDKEARLKWKEQREKYKKEFEGYPISFNSFCTIIVDLSNMLKFDTLDNSDNVNDESIITLYETDMKVKELFAKIGIEVNDKAFINNNTVRLSKDNYLKLKKEAYYLIAMSVTDIANFDSESFDFDETYPMNIPDPTNEPVIGVIDTLFDKHVYFHKWVEFEDWTDKEMDRDSSSYIHGTAVSSIIVDGPSINPELDDGCGRFRVKHFGVALEGKNSSTTIIRNIKDIIEANRNIKVWNLSLGSPDEINSNFISPEAAILDELQYKYDILFIIAGTNKPNGVNGEYKIGYPADSINSIVVNSVDENANIASYSRKGKVLSFFYKPDLCYYGGDITCPLSTCTGLGEKLTAGTSFAAPWITRKAAFLIEKLGLTREIAKALLIDSAIGWDMVNDEKSEYYGFGVVPKRIENILTSPKEEIKFYIEGLANSYETYAHNIPVPLNSDKYPYIARATLCYFPKCSRNQGVDYTNTELDLYFGRIRDDGSINSIDSNNQSEGTPSYLKEEGAREYHRKWDNVKHINYEIKEKLGELKSYSNKLWALSIKAKDRLKSIKDNEVKFGVVITLKEINGINRYDDFKKMCSVNGWIVNDITIENRLEIYNNANEEITFD